MAVDEALLEAAVAVGLSAVRVYRWAEPTISLGYFQAQHAGAATLIHETPPGGSFDPSHPTGSLPVVRRLSGGGAILHDRELTYSLVVPAAHPLAREPGALYTLAHERIIDLLAELGVRAQLRGQARPAGPEPFFCFGRVDPRDIVIGTDKIVGSAQRRRHGAILQHGALLLEHSPFAPEYAGLFDLVPDAARVEDLAARLATALAAGIGTPELCPNLDAQLARRARDLDPVYWVGPRTV